MKCKISTWILMSQVVITPHRCTYIQTTSISEHVFKKDELASSVYSI